ncbi:MAG: insulinase family protein [Prevotellaceae bacterium]|jgi:predicted Zn-dependent peptidase/outer membrane lipoprotein-sorting protein|nr:insulinase family protein [Prevotellaceae bacterium]
MKKIFNIVVLLLCVATLSAQTVDRSIRPAAAPAKEIDIKDAKIFTLANGLKVFVVEDNRAPIVYYSLQLDIKPALGGNKAGLQESFGGVIGTATKTKTKEQLNKEIDLIAARMNLNDRGGYGSSLKKYESKMLELLADMILNPVFTQEELDLNKTQQKSGLQYINDDPASISSRMASALAYGKDFPSGEVETIETIDNVTVSDLELFYSTYFAPNAMRLVIVGNITEAEAKANAEKYFGMWEKKNVPETSYTIPQAPAQSKVAMFNKDGAVQSVVSLVYPVDFKPGAPDIEAARIANYVLGGGMAGRLFMNLRETNSYTYGVYSFLREGEQVGLFEISSGRNGGASVKANTTDSSLMQIIYEMNRMINTPITEDDLKGAKAYIAGSFGRSLQESSTIARFAVNIDKYNLPKDYYKNYLKRLEAVTISDVQAAAKKYFKPENAWVVVVGDKSHAETLKQFDSNNTVQFYDINVNPIAAPETKTAEITTEQIIDNYVKALGGVAAIEAINDYKMTGSVSAMGQQLVFSQMFKKPEMSLTTITMNGMVVQKVIFNGKTLNMSGMAGNQEFTKGKEFDAIKAEAGICPPMNFVKNGYTMTVKGIENDAYILDVDSGSLKTYWFDTKTGLLIKTSTTADTPQGTIQQIMEFSDYRPVNGILFPYTIKQKAAGMEMVTTISDVKVNAGLTNEDFK